MLGKYYHSVRQLTPTQIWGRVGYMARRKTLHRSDRYLAQFRNGSNEGKPFRQLPFDVDKHHADRLDAYAKGRFTFLNCTADLKLDETNGDALRINWQPTDVTQLWAYNLHYFNYAMELAQHFAIDQKTEAYTVFRDLVESWIDSCPPPMAVAWDPYPTSLRASNWIKAYTFFEAELKNDAAFAERMRNSLYAQLKFLADHLEYHVMGNHLIENGRALLIGGLFFQDDLAEKWRKKGWQIIWQELDKQFLDDGANYERSPMYHQIMLGLYDEAVTLVDSIQRQTQEQVADPTQVAHMRSRVVDMRKWLTAMLHPDGQIALYNDSAFDIAPPPSVQLGPVQIEPVQLEPAVEATQERHTGLDPWPESGYFAFRDPQAQNLLLCDYGPFGASDQPGHAHCDALSYELSLAGERMIVDSGVGCYYGEPGWRTYYRSTRAHNTVVIDGEEQSEIWSRFRVARRADARNVHWLSDDQTLSYVIGSHTGYQRLAQPVEHRRWICWVDQRFWLICDRLSGEGAHVAESMVHFHPEVTIQQTPQWINGYAAKATGTATRGNTTLQVLPWGLDSVKTYCGEADPLQGWYAPEFGKDLKNTVWGFSREDRLPFWFGYILWPSAAGAAEEIAVASVADGADSCQITVTSQTDEYTIRCSEFDILYT